MNKENDFFLDPENQEKEECKLGNDLAEFLEDVLAGEYFFNQDTQQYEMV